MNEECIHGLDGELCALCFPPAAPVAPTVPAARAPRASRARTPEAPTALRTIVAPITTGTARTKRHDDKVGEQRIYHLTHIRNLPGILATGRLLADTSADWTDRPVVDISSPENRSARRDVRVSGADSLAVADHVPFFLSPNALVWENIRAQSLDPRLSDDAHDAAAYDFVILVSTVKKVLDAQVDAAADPTASHFAVTDGDAAFTATRFGATAESADRMLQTLRADLDSDAILKAELLVPGEVPFGLITLIGVANDRVRDAVKPILATLSHKPKVAVYPPWFHPTEEL
ncbi:hypothetical protein RCH12_002259 [Cryobacterium sp. MP_3.1]|uniref:DarT domain-containing protein n=1 Tax=Cryobacterium zongtaii TaxID=1259217 RepID=A0A2S3ZNJ3_9MICO|nr:MULTISPECIES: DUF4433 domain-containing protein [Cryobacterium]MEC5184789.1 hypothetical protein [Cryobacterium sp. MP_3.1]POH70748.1 hypothetical protein C3B59_03505 [Cryobacterium zongtaii]